jgi:hypothetical protein
VDSHVRDVQRFGQLLDAQRAVLAQEIKDSGLTLGR